ncbi:hypothetical protein CAF53_19760 [Sphingobium sp. LB126]|uniref:MFS transporter n=1 Tax=Sphingobium sp. LB126 TaxID=1983755 RepID=UPI000C205E3C|nr:MFS transporter [Sphingobium sp. LB126]PJG46417.1 hypothetical protein CAF53_19760 [Sphingobium sp. LB126]
MILTIIVSAELMIALDYAMTSVGLPALGIDLRLQPDQLQWVLSSYSLTFGGLLIVGGYLSDLWGGRRCYVRGCLLFGAGALCCAVAPFYGLLLAGRCLQGLGGAILLPATLSLTASTFADGPERIKALGIIAVSGMAATAGGTIIAGFLVSTFGWRGPYPFAALLVFACAIFGALLLPRADGFAKKPGGLDPIAILLITLCSSLLVWSLSTIASKGLGSPPLILSAFAASLIMFGVFILLQRKAAIPLIPPGMLRKPKVIGGIVMSSLIAGSAACMIVLVSLTLQRSFGLTPIQVGYALAPFGITSVLLGIAMRRMSTLLARRVRRNMFAALCLNMGGLFMMSLVSGSASQYAYTVPIIMMSVGSVIGLALAMGEIYAGIEPDEKGIASALCYVARLLWSAIVVAFSIGAIGHIGAQDQRIPAEHFAGGFQIGAFCLIPGLLVLAMLFRTERAGAIAGDEADASFASGDAAT